MERQAFRQLRQAVEDVCRDVPVAHLLRPEEWPPHRPRSALVRPNWCRRIEGFPVSGPTRALTAAVAERAVSRLDPVSQAVVRMHQWIVELLLEASSLLRHSSDWRRCPHPLSVGRICAPWICRWWMRPAR